MDSAKLFISTSPIYICSISYYLQPEVNACIKLHAQVAIMP